MKNIKQSYRFIYVFGLCFFFIVTVSLSSCRDASFGEAYREPVDGSRIGWDYSSLRKVAPPEGRSDILSYPRLAELAGGDLLVIYESVSAGTVETVRSRDGGLSWEEPRVLFSTVNRVAPAVPEIIQLQSGVILAAANRRPREPYSPDRPFAISVRKSPDGGATWLPEQVVYEAGHTFEDGCWEPAFLELPSGEVQLYFADEGPFTESNEQNISLLRSFDEGDTWTAEPVVASFREGRRDGMPVPLLLPERREILYALEDNLRGVFKPSVIRESLDSNWNSGPVDGDDPRRHYHPMEEQTRFSAYAGAPYLTRLPGGEVVLSFQSNQDRGGEWEQSSQRVMIGSAAGQDFSRSSVPFDISDQSRGLWNSVRVLKNERVAALTSTDGYSGSNAEVWMIEGVVIPELYAQQGQVTVDGYADPSEWPEKRIFVGHRGQTSFYGDLQWDDGYLYFTAVVTDAGVHTDSDSPEEDDGVILFFDPEGLNTESLQPGLLSYTVNPDGRVELRRVEEGEWIPAGRPEGILLSARITGEGYTLEMGIPWRQLGGRPPESRRIGFNAALTEDADGGYAEYRESISSNREEASYTWSPLYASL